MSPFTYNGDTPFFDPIPFSRSAGVLSYPHPTFDDIMSPFYAESDIRIQCPHHWLLSVSAQEVTTPNREHGNRRYGGFSRDRSQCLCGCRTLAFRGFFSHS